MIEISSAEIDDLDEILAVHRVAFGSNIESSLVLALINDPTAHPVFSLVAKDQDQVVGHILFTRASFDPEVDLSLSILAPLAVSPNNQGKGIGGALIEQGLRQLTEHGVDLVFVLGYPDYYTRYGFKPAGSVGFEATYPIPEHLSDAWMFKTLSSDPVGRYRGKVVCAACLDQPEYWAE